MRPKITESGATISSDQKYRYRLWRGWGPDLLLPNAHERVLWVMLNPSTACVEKDDPTIRKCMGFAHRWGYGGIDVVNLFGLRATNPKALWEEDIDPVGKFADRFIQEALMDSRTGKVVVAWGAAGSHRALRREKVVLEFVRSEGHRPMCLGVTKESWPRHPLMLPYATQLERYQ